jgi:glutamine cyclotransferase
MNKRHNVPAAIFFATVLAAVVISIVIANYQQTTEQMQSPTPTANPTASTAAQYTYTVMNIYPHDTAAFTEGLVYDKGSLFESTGGYGASSLRRVDLETGTVQQQVNLSSVFFGEGLTVIGDSLIQLTWQNNEGFVYNKETFEVQSIFSYPTEGWGLTFDGNQLIMSNGSSTLIFLDAHTHEKTGEVTVKDGGKPVANLNELEYINGDVYANIWMEQKIAIINPQTGQVKGWIDLAGLYQPDNSNAVLNGIAYDKQNDRLFVTGKNWPNLYQIKITPAP